VDLLALVSAVGRNDVPVSAAEALFQINLFQVIVAATNFAVFLLLMWTFAFKPVAKMLGDRQARFEQGLKDAEQARKDRESAEQERLAALAEARRESNAILARAQKIAQETRDADIAATRTELERLRSKATEEIEGEKQKALQELRSEVADLALAAAGKVVGESMNDARQRKLVEEFLASTPVADEKN
jgi:F-type H+-transporting ATPase subunit b